MPQLKIEFVSGLEMIAQNRPTLILKQVKVFAKNGKET